jgi:hypothetical protein
VARLDEADTIITDTGLNPAARSQLASSVRRLILVDVVTGERQTIESGTESAQAADRSLPGGRG